MGVDQPQCGAGRASGKRDAGGGVRDSQEPAGKSPHIPTFSNPRGPLAATLTPGTGPKT
jgi:hypothetical protein